MNDHQDPSATEYVASEYSEQDDDTVATESNESLATSNEEALAEGEPVKENLDEEARQKTRNGIIQNQIIKLSDAESEEERQEILAKYPKLKAEIELRHNDLTGEVSQIDDDIESKVDAAVAKKLQADKIEKTLIEKGVKGLANYNKLKEAAQSLVSKGFSVEEAVQSVSSLGKTKTQPTVPRNDSKAIDALELMSPKQHDSLPIDKQKAYSKKCVEQFGELKFR